jgi:A/G-specific adenine glycosylase
MSFGLAQRQSSSVPMTSPAKSNPNAPPRDPRGRSDRAGGVARSQSAAVVPVVDDATAPGRGGREPRASAMPVADPLSPASAALAVPLEAWFAGARRDLPWRRRPSGWHALVSELMLQQTQVARVVERFDAFVARFPTPRALADAPEDAVLALWQGLGYYRRARLLQAAARAIVERHAGEVPADRASLEALPGVGRYTAGAVASIAFGAREAIVDGNVARVLQRVHLREGASTDRAVAAWAWDEAAAFVAGAGRPGVANEALMELGATVCTPAAPRCGACPLASSCRARAEGRTDAIPAPKPRAARRALVLVTARIERASDGAILLEQRAATGLWARLWQPPTVECADADGGELSPQAAARLLALGGGGATPPLLEPREGFTFQTTHRDILFVVFAARIRGRGDGLATDGRRWVAPADLAEFALSNAAKRVVLAGA